MDNKNHVLELEETPNIKNSILIVDDDGLIAQALTHILSPEYTVYVARDGQDAIDVAREMNPDVILLDVLMPGMSGFHVISVLKNMAETRDIPVIFVTGLDSAKDEEKGLILGAADYIHKPFTPAIVKLRVSNQIKIINQMRLIHRMSVTDSLTNVANRRQFNSHLEQEWKRSVRFQSSVSVLMLDIDHFKVFNDNFGHIQGDIVLQTVANLIKDMLKRPRDLVARWGGEEFAVVLPDTNMHGAYKVAEDIRIAIENYVLLFKEDMPIRITVSIGVNSLVPGQHSSVDRFISDADKALYQAKGAGRNRVFASEPL